MDAFESVAPYLSNIREIREFVERNKDKNDKEIIELIEERIGSSRADLATDYRILLNEIRKMINTEL